MNPLNPKKLLLTKWTALQPSHKDKHFLVAKVVLPEPLKETGTFDVTIKLHADVTPAIKVWIVEG